MVKKIAVLTSGGDAPGMNAALRAVVCTGAYHNVEIIGVERGYYGVIHEQFMPMTVANVNGITQRGGTILRTARCAEFTTPEGFEAALASLHKHEIEDLIIIGGDGSMKGAMKLADAGIRTVVIPATIDNDMLGTEYTLGFDTAANNVLEAVSKIRDTAFSHERIGIIEVMGNHSGHIALMTGIACGAKIILMPEEQFDLQEIAQKITRNFASGDLYSIVIVAEGVGDSRIIAEQLKSLTGFGTQVTILGYIQRGGQPSVTDNNMGSLMGAVAVKSILSGNVNSLIASRRGKITAVPYREAISFKNDIEPQMYELAQILAV